MDFIQASDFFASLASDERVYFLVRHAERRHITPEDPDFGAHVGLTDKGREQALGLGRCIPADGDMVFFSSPVGRCMETAQCIGKGRMMVAGAAQVADIPHVEPLGCLGDYFVQNQVEFEKVLRAGFYEGICEWLAREETRGSSFGSQDVARIPRAEKEAFYPLAKRSEEMLAMMLELGNARFNIFATHDAWIVPCLTHFCKMTFTPQRWMNYLTGMAVVTDTKKVVKRIVPVTALESGWLAF